MCARTLPLAAVGAFALAALAATAAHAAEAAPVVPPAGHNATVPSGAAILQELREFRTFGTVLMVAAHPDDENRPLLAFLSKGLDLRTGYLSINRGDGGQNEIGPEFGDRLGVIRTQELLAGRRIDGARQFFTRAVDFGYSKSMEETLRIWDHAQVLGDVVRVIRTFRPDVITTVFAPVPQPGNHGHHNASAFLATEAFKLAGDPSAYPEQIAEGLQPWQPKRIVQNGGNSLSISGGNTDPATGETVQAIAARTSAQHKTQGVGGGRGGAGGGNFSAGFTLLDGTPGADLMDGVDATWARVPNGGAEIAQLADELTANFKPDASDASVPAILALRAKLTALKSGDPVVVEKRGLLDRILQHCIGLTISSTTQTSEILAGEQMTVDYNVVVSSNIPVGFLKYVVSFDVGTAFSDQNHFYSSGGTFIVESEQLKSGQISSGSLQSPVFPRIRITQPYWLREEPAAGMYRVATSDVKYISLPENPVRFYVNYEFMVGGQSLRVHDEIRVAGDSSQLPRGIAIVSPITLKFGSSVALFTPGASKPIEVEVTAGRAGATGTLRLESPSGWTISPAGLPFKLAQAGEKTKATFTVTAPATAASGSFLAVAEMADGTRYSNQHEEIHYDHIPTQVLQFPARLKVVAANFAIRGKFVGYLPGAGDATAEALTQLGYAVTTLTGADLTPEKLRGLDAVVIGVRAFNERPDFAANFPGLLAYAEAGGTVIAQYNRPNGLRTSQLGPYPLSIQGQAPPLRVTDENAPVTFLLPNHPALNTPNKITAADFAGWVQERGAYFASSWDEQNYAAPLAMSDPGETQPNSSLLIAKYGKGYYVYTSLAFFRQLPAGVPGAYRLFANLVSLGK